MNARVFQTWIREVGGGYGISGNKLSQKTRRNWYTLFVQIGRKTQNGIDWKCRYMIHSRVVRSSVVVSLAPLETVRISTASVKCRARHTHTRPLKHSWMSTVYWFDCRQLYSKILFLRRGSHAFEASAATRQSLWVGVQICFLDAFNALQYVIFTHTKHIHHILIFIVSSQ